MRSHTKLYVLMEMIDILTTMVAITWLGAVEISPTLAGLPLFQIVFVKLVQVAFFMAILEYPLRIPRVLQFAYWLPGLYFFYPAIHNIRVILIILTA